MFSKVERRFTGSRFTEQATTSLFCRNTNLQCHQIHVTDRMGWQSEQGVRFESGGGLCLDEPHTYTQVSYLLGTF